MDAEAPVGDEVMEVLQEASLCLFQLKAFLQVCLRNAHSRRRVRVDETFFGEVQIPLVLVAVVLRRLQLLELVSRNGQRHRQSLSVNVQLGALRVLLEALLGVLAALELGKGRAATLFSVRVDDHLAVLQGAETGTEELGEVRFGGVQVEVANEDGLLLGDVARLGGFAVFGFFALWIVVVVVIIIIVLFLSFIINFNVIIIIVFFFIVIIIYFCFGTCFICFFFFFRIIT